MKYSRISTAVVFLLHLFLKSGEAVDCYVCNSVTDSNCGDPFKEGSQMTESDCNYCTKSKAEGSGVEAVTRACVTMGEISKDSCKDASYSGSTVNICECAGNLCNGARPEAVSVLVPGLLLLLATVTARFLTA